MTKESSLKVRVAYLEGQSDVDLKTIHELMKINNKLIYLTTATRVENEALHKMLDAIGPQNWLLVCPQPDCATGNVYATGNCYIESP